MAGAAEMVGHAVENVLLSPFVLGTAVNLDGDVVCFGRVERFFAHATQEQIFCCATASNCEEFVRNRLASAERACFSSVSNKTGGLPPEDRPT